MRRPIITLTTDFGAGSAYVAAMKGVLLGGNPRLQLVDISHTVPPQDIRQAALVLADTTPYFPAGTIHVVVVDPGVGTARALVHVLAGGMQFLAPDNGVLGLVAERWPPASIREIREPRYWRATVSATFQGRDILAPVAAHLSCGLDPALLGPPHAHLVPLSLPRPRILADRVIGEIVSVDPFGNLITNLTRDDLPRVLDLTKITCQGRSITGLSSTYGACPPATLIALFGSTGRLEIAVVNGSAAAALGGKVGQPVIVDPECSVIA